MNTKSSNCIHADNINLRRFAMQLYFAGDAKRYVQKPLCGVTYWVTNSRMIQSFKHKGLERFFKTGKKAGIQAKHANRLRLILGRLNASTSPADMDLPGLYLHQLTGDRKET